MRVLVDLLFYTGTRGGMESYVRRLYGEIASGGLEEAHGFEFVGLASRELTKLGAPWFPGELMDSGISGSSRVAWARGELGAVAPAARRADAALIHSPANIGPARSAVPVVLTLHDLLPFVHPEWVPGPYAPVLRGLGRAAARNARHLLTISEASRSDILRYLRLAAAQVEVVPLAAGASTRAPAGPSGRAGLLAVGNRMPHKGFDTLLSALATIPAARRPHLTVTGGGSNDPLRAEVARRGLTNSVSLPGWLSAAELDALYARSAIYVFPTRFEGFGLPMLEAMSQGCPVMASELPVLREVGGDAAVYVPADDPRAWAERIMTLLEDPAERERLTEAGVARAGHFSWKRTARMTLAAFHRTLS
jgi:glycosyltransferase involved in cell wall biosynthesis